MHSLIKFSEIPLFCFFNQDMKDATARLFNEKNFCRNHKIVEANQIFDGMYVVVDGEVGVTLPPENYQVGKITHGGAIGELSFIEDHQYSSVNIIVTSETSRMLFCKRDHFNDLLQSDQGLAHAFYKGAALLLSSRLRKTNVSLLTQLKLGQEILKNLIERQGVGEYLDQTRDAIEDTGYNIVKRVADILPKLNEIEHQYPELRDWLMKLEQELAGVYIIESQRFDRIAQQISIISQHFENIRRVVSGEEPLPIVGDKNLFVANAKVS
ncbi:MAG: Crp/Fnr family transcriptional regulator [Oligoflexales bacterium]|nr:Crp/Fnr family transcriptional regulator [Oligoflexales bacterium]